MTTIKIIYGDLLEQPVDAIVNAWNRNFIPWWLLLPQGVSGAIKKRAGYQPFKELSTHGVLSVGEAVLTSAGKLPYQGIIHVAGINAWWVATEQSITQSVKSAIHLAEIQGYQSIAMPLIGAGTGGKNQKKVQEVILQSLEKQNLKLVVHVVIYSK